jgi:hypothetical protein
MSSFRAEFHASEYHMFRTAKKATLGLYNDNDSEVQDEAEPDEKE